MKLLVGLGNPGEKYASTRHNLGFRILNQIACIYDIDFSNEKKFNSEIAETEIEGQKIILVKPQTFMNNSGLAISKIINFYKIPLADLILVYDDKDLDFGEIRLRSKGGSAGHKGVQSIIDNIGTENFTRFRIGIMNQEGNNIPTESFVLQNFTSEEEAGLENIIQTCIDKITESIRKA